MWFKFSIFINQLGTTPYNDCSDLYHYIWFFWTQNKKTEECNSEEGSDWAGFDKKSPKRRLSANKLKPISILNNNDDEADDDDDKDDENNNNNDDDNDDDDDE